MDVSLRHSALLAGISLALMALIAPLGVMVALPAGATGAAGLAVLVVVILDIVAAIALYFVFRAVNPLLSVISSALRIAYAAVFATAAGFLFAPADTERFDAIWTAGLLVFGAHLILAGILVINSSYIPSWIGILLIIAGLGYVFDTSISALAPDRTFSIGEFTFIGEVVFLIWLIGWGGRVLRSA